MLRLQNFTRNFAALVALLVTCAAAPIANAQEGSLVSWGKNNFGQINNTPAGTFSSVAAGDYHSVAIRTDGTLASWGYDIGGSVNNTPSGTFIAVAVGSYFSLGIRTDGTLAKWGALDLGVVSGTFVAVAAGSAHGVAIRTDGTLASWGEYNSIRETPSGTFVAVAAGYGEGLAIRTDGTLTAWGNGINNQPIQPPPLGTFSAIAAAESHAVAIRSDGTIVAWGDDQFGKVSGPNADSRSFTAVAAGYSHTIAITTDGTLVTWGSNEFGQVSDTPVGNFTAVATKGDHCVGILAPDNQAPLATDDFYGMNQAGSLSVAAPGVVANDSDPDEDALTAELVTGPANATSFQLNPDGSFSYTPTLNFNGEDSFTYRAYDGTEYSETVTVHITVSQPGSQGFITGGGKFFQDGRKCTFGFVAKVQGTVVQGQLEFQDHEAGIDLRSQSMQWVYAPNQVDGSFSGECSLNGVGGYTFFVQVHDLGQPGNNDGFSIWVYDALNNPVSTASGVLAGGNIVIHEN